MSGSDNVKVYIQSYENGIPHNYNFMNAYQGFYEMGFEIVRFSDNQTLSQSCKKDVVVGYVGTVRSRLYDFGIVTPEMDYPDELFPLSRLLIQIISMNQRCPHLTTPGDNALLPSPEVKHLTPIRNSLYERELVCGGPQSLHRRRQTMELTSFCIVN